MARRLENGADLRGPLLLNGSPGTPGQVPVSAGPSATPGWGSTSSVDYGRVLAVQYGAAMP